MPRVYGVPEYWNDRYHALFDQVVEHANREFEGLPEIKNCEAFNPSILRDFDEETAAAWWTGPFEPPVLNYEVDRDRFVSTADMFFLTGPGFQRELPVLMQGELDPDYDVDLSGLFLYDTIRETIVGSFSYGQNRVVRQYFEMMRLHGKDIAKDLIDNPWRDFPPFFETVEPEF